MFLSPRNHNGRNFVFSKPLCNATGGDSQQKQLNEAVPAQRGLWLHCPALYLTEGCRLLRVQARQLRAGRSDPSRQEGSKNRLPTAELALFSLNHQPAFSFVSDWCPEFCINPTHGFSPPRLPQVICVLSSSSRVPAPTSLIAPARCPFSPPML